MTFSAETLAAIQAAGAAQEQALNGMEKVPGRILHVDGDYVSYYYGCIDATKEEARRYTLNGLEKFRVATGSEKVLVHLTQAGSHKGERYLAATVKKYQGQRSSERQLFNKSYLDEWLATYDGPEFEAKPWATREADDGMAAMCLYAVSQGRLDAIATRDKDLRMVPALHVAWQNPEIVTEVPPGTYDVIGKDVKQYGLKWFWLQMLQGDTADNIPGLEEYQAFDAKGNIVYKKMGEKTAEKMLQDCLDVDAACDRVRELYLNAYTKCDDEGNVLNPGEWADRFVEQAALLWMRTDNKAHLLDFLNHSGPSCINRRFCSEIHSAAGRLIMRVNAQRAEIDKLAS
ncbi:exonuclease [Caulobacter phage Lullwater]|uniref:5'-3' exonuclease n=1 Tax=Caulobacter phage Lullwater TaxID=2024607 RepID=A0A291LB24_9CAUD|nr:exonuclease [Caulobacter phage Lullwater]ATI16327.1 5'-3' exonuclease [Caulobacter phage Lullwater]